MFEAFGMHCNNNMQYEGSQRAVDGSSLEQRRPAADWSGRQVSLLRLGEQQQSPVTMPVWVWVLDMHPDDSLGVIGST